MRIVYTKHAFQKFIDLTKINWHFTKTDVENAIKYSDNFQIDADRGVKIILKSIDEKHDLRIICKQNSGIIKIITFYPVRKGRYEKNQNNI